MSFIVSPKLNDVYTVLHPFLVAVTGLDPALVLQGIQNRVAMPKAAPGFAIFQVIGQRRLNTNIHTWDTANPAPNSIATEEHVQLSVQLDCYGADSLAWATMLQTLLRDNVGCEALAPVCQPLYTSELQMIPLTDSEEQYEQRWTFTAEIQYNPVTTVLQDFAATAAIDVISVDERYPPQAIFGHGAILEGLDTVVGVGSTA